MTSQLITLRIIWALLLISLVVFVGCRKPPTLTNAQYQNLKIGMTLAEVENILGSPGVEDPTKRGQTMLYTWKIGTVPINMIFIDGCLRNKVPRHIDDGPPELRLRYEKIMDNMRYDTVCRILRKRGRLVEVKTFYWPHQKGEICIEFHDGVLANKWWIEWRH